MPKVFCGIHMQALSAPPPCIADSSREHCSECLQQAMELYLWDRHSFRMNLQRFLPSEMSPETPMPKWSSILKSFLWKVPISADVRFIDARTICVVLCGSQPSA